MKPSGFIDDEWLVSYAAGALSEAHALVVATHVEYHDELKSKLADAEAIGGGLLEEAEPENISEDMLDNIFAAIEDGASIDEQSRITVADSKMPAALRDYIGKDLSDLKWRMMGPGMSQVRLWTGPNDERLWLLKAKGGVSIPTHDHNGIEMTLVLKGSYTVDGQRYSKGMIEIADGDVEGHTPIIDEGEECICLVVTEAPIRIHSFLGRMVQPFIGL
jgi:putative transcriptional regulator